jgi:hypothetical protein
VGTSRFHCTAAYTRCLRCAGAPRRPTSGSELSLHIASCHAALSDPGEFEHRIVQIHDADMVFAMGTLARHSRSLHNPFHVGVHFGAARVHNCYSLTGCSPPRTDLTGTRFQPQEAFTSRLSTERSPLPSLDMTTTSIGLLCRRDFHPLQWQLASLHAPTERGVRISRTTLFSSWLTASLLFVQVSFPWLADLLFE